MPPKKMGRPPSDNPLAERLYLRVDSKTKVKLDACTEVLKTTRSDVIRMGIEKVYDDLKNERSGAHPTNRHRFLPPAAGPKGTAA